MDKAPILTEDEIAKKLLDFDTVLISIIKMNWDKLCDEDKEGFIVQARQILPIANASKVKMIEEIEDKFRPLPAYSVLKTAKGKKDIRIQEPPANYITQDDWQSLKAKYGGK